MNHLLLNKAYYSANNKLQAGDLKNVNGQE
jgi:hypothetical protein